MTIAIISHNDCALHDNGSAHHPESSDRLGAINNRLITSGVDWIVRHYDAEPADREQLERVHDAAYIDQIFARAPKGDEVIDLDGDTGMNQHTLSAALHSAGAATQGVDMVMNGTHKHVFCETRPPGHHAKRAQSAGFCIFNNVAVGAAQAMAVHGLERVLIVDFDVHHGDGTENIFQDEQRVLFCSSFQHPYYPFSGADTDLPNILNLPLAGGTGSAAWRDAIRERWLPRIEAFQPQLIMISAGFDSHLEDDMGGFNLVESDYVWITEELCRIAKASGAARIVSCLEGGYDLSSLGRSATAHIKVLAEYH